MKKLVIAASLAAMAAASASASAADMEREIGLIVSGVVDQWAGVQIIDNTLPGNNASEALFVNGGEGRLSLPLGTNLSIQNDFKYEYNTNATGTTSGLPPYGPEFSFLGAGHLSWRNPSQALFGVFGGAGSVNFSDIEHDIRFVGGEAQLYLDNITLYVQGGYVDYSYAGAITPSTFSMDDGFFARGVLRWFMADGSRLQFEGSYFNHDYIQLPGSEGEIFSAGARYDFDIDLPIAGQTPLYIGYRGVFREDCFEGYDIDDHTIMIGTSYAFSGDRLTVDRQGATLDTPHFSSCIQ